MLQNTNILYKMNVDEIKAKIREHYLPFVHNYTQSKDYKNTKFKYLSVCLILFILAISSFLYIAFYCGFFENTIIEDIPPILIKFIGLMFFLTIYIIFYPLINFVNRKFLDYERNHFINKFIYNFTNLNSYNIREPLPYTNWEMRRKQKEDDKLIKDHELLISSELFKKLGDHRITHCAYQSNYNGVDFAIENMTLLHDWTWTVLNAAFIIGKWIIIKATFNHKLNKAEIDNKNFQNIVSKIGDLLNSLEIKYNIYSNNIMLAIKTNENLFETKNLLTLSANSDISERFISQLTGILIFMDYAATEINK